MDISLVKIEMENDCSSFSSSINQGFLFGPENDDFKSVGMCCGDGLIQLFPSHTELNNVISVKIHDDAITYGFPVL